MIEKEVAEMECNIQNADLVLNKAIAQIWKTERYSYQSTARPDHGFLYLAKGRITYTFADGVIEMKPGDIIYLPKNSNYDVTFGVQCGTVEDMLINFDVVGEKPFGEICNPVCVLNDRSGGLEHYFRDVVNAYYEKGKSFLTSMLLYRCLHELQEIIRIGTENEENVWIRKAAMMLTEEPEMTIEGICEKLHTSRSIFQKRFKAFLGVTPAAYRIEKRIEKAKLLLETTDIPIKEIVIQLGFYDLAYFYKVFERYTSLTPRQYREKNKPYF
jgi:AraC-like DNA-binding protein/mannose-6-phosphate isomerase-like protein (cupin superfamily)